MAEAIGAEVLVEDGQVLRFAHPLLAAEAYGRAAPEARRAVHRILASVVAEPEENARHLALSTDGPDADIADALERAALRARQRGALDAAAELSERAAALTPDDRRNEALRRVRAAAHYLLQLGDTGHARELLEASLDTAPAGPSRAAILTGLGEVRQVMDDWGAAESLYLAALDEAGGDPRLEIQVRLDLAGVGFITGRNWNAAAEHASDAMRLADELDDAEMLAGTIGHYAAWQYATGHGLRRDLMERAASLEPWTGHLRILDHPDFDFAYQLLDEGDRPGFRERIERLIAKAERAGDYSSLSFLLANLAEADIDDGSADLALARLDRSERIARSIDQETALAHVLTARTGIMARLGRESEARQAADGALKLIAKTGWRQGDLRVLAGLGQLELSIGNAAAAHERFQSVMALWPTPDLDPAWQRQAIPPDVEALVALGRVDDARALLEPYLVGARRLGHAPALADGLRARGLVLAASGDVDGATAALQEADAIYTRIDDSWNRARNLFILGGVHRRARRRAKAREALTEAVEIFDRLGAQLWAARARHELGRGASRRGAPEGGLTETQRRIAEHVSAGRTNRQVAYALFMSVHTVEAHLSAIYRTLGIGSRAELARTFRDSADSFRDSGAKTHSNV